MKIIPPPQGITGHKFIAHDNGRKSNRQGRFYKVHRGFYKVHNMHSAISRDEMRQVCGNE